MTTMNGNSGATQRDIFVDATRLDIAMAIAGLRTDEKLAEKSGVDDRTLRNIRKLGKCSFDTLNKIASAIGCNPIDLLRTTGYPDPKWDALAALSI